MVAYFRDEPGAAQVESLLTKTAQADRLLHTTEVNYAEAKAILPRKDGLASWDVAAKILVALPIEFHPADCELADPAADLKSCFSVNIAMPGLSSTGLAQSIRGSIADACRSIQQDRVSHGDAPGPHRLKFLRW